MSLQDELTNKTVILKGDPIPAILPTKIFTLYYNKGFKAAIFSQMGTSDSWIQYPITIRNLVRYYLGK